MRRIATAASRPSPRCTRRRTNAKGPGVRREAAAGVERVLRCGEGTGTGTAAPPITTGASTPSGSGPISTWCWPSTTGWPRRSTTTSTSPTPSPRWTPIRCGTCGWTRATGRSPPSSPRPRRCSTLAPRLAGQTADGRAAASAQPQRVPPEHRRPRGDDLVAWLEWQEGRGDRLVAERGPDGRRRRRRGPRTCSGPTAAVTADGVPWLVSAGPVGAVGVWACRFVDGGGATRNRSSDTDGPSFNQEVAASDDGGLHVCWQGRAGGRFGVFARRWDGSGWEATVRVSEGGRRATCGTRASRSSTTAREWEWPTPGPSTSTAATPSRCAASTRAAAPARSGGSPAAATTRCTPAWPRPPTAACGAPSTSISVQGHGGSGPTRLRPRPTRDRPGRRPRRHAGAGRSVPPELLPEVSADIRVVRVDDDGAGGAARRAGARARRGPVGAAPAAGHRRTGAWSSATGSTASCR